MTAKGSGRPVTDVAYWDGCWAGRPLPQYDAASPYFRLYVDVFAPIVERLRRRTGRVPRIIDVGCGNGLMLRFFKEHFGLDVAGIDSSNVWRQAEAMARTLGLDLDIRQCDLMDTDAAARLGRFDIVTSFGLVEHFQEPMEPLRRLRDLLSPGGCLFTLVPNFHGLFDRLWRLYDRRNYARHVPITVPQLRDAYRELGLKDTVVYALPRRGLPGVHDQELAGRKLLAAAVRFVNRHFVAGPVGEDFVVRGDTVGMIPEVCIVGWKRWDSE